MSCSFPRLEGGEKFSFFDSCDIIPSFFVRAVRITPALGLLGASCICHFFITGIFFKPRTKLQRLLVTSRERKLMQQQQQQQQQHQSEGSDASGANADVNRNQHHHRRFFRPLAPDEGDASPPDDDSHRRNISRTSHSSGISRSQKARHSQHLILHLLIPRDGNRRESSSVSMSLKKCISVESHTSQDDERAMMTITPLPQQRSSSAPRVGGGRRRREEEEEEECPHGKR